MKKIIKKILPILLAVLLITVAMSAFITPIEADAATYITDHSKVKGSDYTSVSSLASLLDEIFAGDIDIYSNSSFTTEVSMPLGSRMSMSTQYYVKSKTTGNDCSGWQCYIYANAVYNKIYKEWVGSGDSFAHSKRVISGGSSTASYEMFKNAGVRCGAYMRTTTNSDGSFNGKYGHSLIILTYNSSSLTYLEGNGDANGLVDIVTKTWSEFNNGTLNGRYISHVVQPTDSYYNSLYGKSGSNYTDSEKLASLIDQVISGDIDIYSNSACTTEVSMPVGTKMSNSTQYYVKSKTTGNLCSGWQCYIYANAVYNKLYNEWIGSGGAFAHSKKVISGGSNTLTYDMLKNAGVRCGAYMRTTDKSNGAYNGNAGHSIIILSYDSNSITYLEGNGDGNGAIRLMTETWSAFNSGELSGRGRYISHIVQPTDDYYVSQYGGIQHTLTIYYNANGGTIDSDSDYYLSSSIVYEKSTSAKLCRNWKYGYLDEHGLHNNTTLGLYRDGYTFLGWSLSTSGGEIIDHDAVIAPESIVPELVNGSKIVTMYAIWEKDVCSHIYDHACDSTCNDCGETREISHEYSYNRDQIDGVSTKHWEECTICGDIINEEPHTYSLVLRDNGEYLVNENVHYMICDICSDFQSEEHIYDNACDDTCNVCGKARTISHTYDNDCDDECNICGRTRLVFNHLGGGTIEYNEQGHWTVCPDCGYTTGVAEHLFGEPIYPDEPTCTEPGRNYKVCGTCGYDESGEIPPTGHSYGDFVMSVDATCTENGEETKTCSTCGDAVTQSIPAKGHTYGDSVVTKEASCNSEGAKEKTCSACADVVVEEIPATDHEYGDWYTVGSDGHGTLTEKRECEICGKYETREVEDPDYDLGVDDEPKGIWEIIAEFFEQIIAWIMNLFGASEE